LHVKICEFLQFHAILGNICC